MVKSLSLLLRIPTSLPQEATSVNTIFLGINTDLPYVQINAFNIQLSTFIKF